MVNESNRVEFGPLLLAARGLISTTVFSHELCVVVCKMLKKLPDTVELMAAFNSMLLAMTDVWTGVSLSEELHRITEAIALVCTVLN